MSNAATNEIALEIKELEKKLAEKKRLQEEKQAALKKVNRVPSKEAKQILKKHIMPALKKGLKEAGLPASVKLEEVLLRADASMFIEAVSKLNADMFQNSDDFYTAAYQLRQHARVIDSEARATAGSIDTGVYVVPGFDKPIEKSKLESNDFIAAVLEHGVEKMRSFRDDEKSEALLSKQREKNRAATVNRLKKNNEAQVH